jgi:hypothetical protein
LKVAHSPSEEGFADRQKFFRNLCIQVRFSGAAQGSRAATNTHSSAKNRRLVLRMLCRALAGGFRANAFLKSTSTNFLRAHRRIEGCRRVECT